MSKQDSDDLISTESKYTRNTENYSENSLSQNTIKNQYSQTCEKSSDEETVTISSENQKEELKHEPSVCKDHKERNIKFSTTSENHRERKLSDRCVSLETIQEILFPIDEKLEQNPTFLSNRQNVSSLRNLNEYDSSDYSELTGSPYSYYHRNVYAMRLDCPKDNVRIKGGEEHFEMKHNVIKKNKNDSEEVIYNPLSQLEKLLEIYTSHKINEELQQDSSSDMSQDEFEFDVEPEIFVEMRRKSDKKSKNQSTPFLHSSSLPQKFYQNLCSERNIYDSENDDQITIKKVRKKTFSKKNSTQAHNSLVKDDSVKKASRCCHKRRKKTSATYFDDTSFKVTEIKQKNKSSAKNKNNKFRTTKTNKLNSVVKNIFNI
ncbi:hypothetical protein WA026_011001 [Henosepilachna vigintioctopunctata]|uniref:Uncharacterized protein n=1 Tax=Henosepilachna vigintioctopunctata TaxID=420089 RepID=A0AAW1UWM2_9CUCU